MIESFVFSRMFQSVTGVYQLNETDSPMIAEVLTLAGSGR